MADGTDIPAWIALFFGVYALAAAIGELHRPGNWSAMFDDFAAHAALRFLAGIACIAIGAAVYLASPWQPDDWLAVVVTVMGGGMVIEGAAFLAFGATVTALARSMLGTPPNRGWAGFSAIMGIALIAVALSRL